MDVWKYYEGKKVFIILKNKRQYSGTILEVESNLNSPLVWIILKDKFGNRITFVNSEVELIQEEKDNG
jgi:small nuclear ribonucleoprotein (snRNP)-like protein